MSCGHTTASTDRFCPVCGTLQERVLCTCLHTNRVDALYCSQCGKKLQDTTAPVTESHTVKDYIQYSLNELVEYANANPVYVDKQPIKLTQTDIHERVKAKRKDLQ